MSATEVRVPCLCGGRHPDGDTIHFRPTLDYAAVAAIRYGAQAARGEDAEMSVPEIMAVLNQGYLLYGIEHWTVEDENGKPLPVSRTAIRERLLTNVPAALMAGDAADDLYGPQVILPLAALGSSLSQPSPTSGSTSPTTGSPSTSTESGVSSTHSVKRPKLSRRSLTTTTQTGVTEAISLSPAGVSKSSRS